MALKRITLFLVLSLLCEIGFLYGDYEVLRNIGTKFRVLIESPTESEAKIGLTKKRLGIVTELRLRKEGMKIVSGKEAILETPFIYVNTRVVGKAFHIRLEVLEWIELKRIPPPNETLATTWKMAFTGINGRDPEYIISSLNILFDGFFNDYYKANPKEKG